MPSRFLTVLTVAALISTTLSIPSRDLFVGDETKYAQVVREMREPGGLLVPTLEGRPYTHKPPVHFWFMAGLTRVFGFDSILGFVLPSLVSCALLALLVFRIGTSLFGPGAGHWASLVFVTFTMIWASAQTARMDLEFALLVTLAVLALRGCREPDSQAQAWAAGMWAGLAALVKGPMGVLIPISFAAVERIQGRRLPRGTLLRLLLPAIAIPLLWVVPAVARGGTEFASEILLRQSLGRAIGAWTHREPPWFYLLHYPATFFPWSILGVVALVGMWRLDRHSPPFRFCLSWILAVLIPFSLISSKLDVYMVPTMIPLALIVGGYLATVSRSAPQRGVVAANLAVSAILVVLGLAGLFVVPAFGSRSPEVLLASEPVVRGLFGILIAGGTSVILWTSVRAAGRDHRSTLGLAIAVVAIGFYVSAFLMPLANRVASTGPLVQAVGELPERGDQIALYFCPHLWSRSMPANAATARRVGADVLRQRGIDVPAVVITQERRAADLGPRLDQEYVRINTVRLIGKDFAIFRRRS